MTLAGKWDNHSNSTLNVMILDNLDVIIIHHDDLAGKRISGFHVLSHLTSRFYWMVQGRKFMLLQETCMYIFE